MKKRQAPESQSLLALPLQEHTQGRPCEHSEKAAATCRPRREPPSEANRAGALILDLPHKPQDGEVMDSYGLIRILSWQHEQTKADFDTKK